MTDILLIVCSFLLVVCIVLLVILLTKKGKTGGSYDHKAMEELKGKIDHLGGAANYTNQAVTNLSSLTEYRLNNMQKNLNKQKAKC